MNALLDEARDRPVWEVLSRLEKLTKTGDRKWKGLCPAHDDHIPSLEVTEWKNGSVRLKCWAECEDLAPWKALGLDHRDFTKMGGKGRGKGRVLATYDYRGEDGELLYQVLRRGDHSFPVRRPDGTDRWIHNRDGVRRVPYRLPELREADEKAWVLVPEGEKDTDNLRKLGLTATCNLGGAGKWTNDDSEHLRGRRVVILPDNDDPGRKHAEKIARSLKDVAREIRVLKLPNLSNKGDASDWIESGGNKEELLRLVDETSPYRHDGRLVCTRVSEIEPEDVEWLWPGRIPLRKLSLVAGMMGVGKSFLIVDLAARVSRGRAWPDAREKPADQGSVLLLNAEDDPADTLRPRLESASADLDCFS